MSEVYQSLLSRMDVLRECYRNREPRAYVGSFEIELDGHRLSLPNSFGLERSEEWIIGQMADGPALIAYESFLLGALEKDPELQELKEGLSELQMRLEDPMPALVYVDEGGVIDIPEYLMEAADLQGKVSVMGCGYGFRIGVLKMGSAALL